MEENIEYKAKEILFILQKTPGIKIATVGLKNSKVDRFDISKDGIVGYDSIHEKLFLEQIALGIEEGGALTIRQFLNKKIKSIDNSGKKIRIPRKSVYGIYLGNNTYRICSSKEIEDAHTIDCVTKERIPKEQGVSYKELKVDLLTEKDRNEEEFKT